MRVGTILGVQDFSKANKPAYQLTIDFGSDLGIKNHPHKLLNAIQKKI